jgi:CheY-like chemotaxis protein
MRRQLEAQGYEVLIATGAPNGLEAGLEAILEIAAQQQPELVVVPLGEPGVDGPGLCRLLRDAAETAAIPVVLLTACPEDHPLTLAALAAGGRDVVSWDAPAPLLCARLDSQIAITRAQARLRRIAMTRSIP